jgi:hypothetical protein
MNTAQHAFVREQFTKWVESTDVAEQCGLTRKEMIDSVEFNEPPKPDRPQSEVIREDQTQLSEKMVSDNALREEFEDNVTRLGKLISRGSRCRDGHVFLDLGCVYCGAKKANEGY